MDDPAVLAALARSRSTRSRDCARLSCPLIPGRPADSATPGHSGRARVIPPAGYLDFIALQASARLVLTDSGGVQEETTVLGVPCLTLRDNTERPITLTEGTNQLVGRDPGRIVAAARQVLTAPPARRAACAVGRPRRTAHRSCAAGQRGQGATASHDAGGRAGPGLSGADVSDLGPLTARASSPGPAVEARRRRLPRKRLILC